MAQNLNPFSARQFLDDDGNPLAGAKLFIYLPGTTTKVTTTQDEAGLVNHTNPIILNARGEPADVAGASKPIWQEDQVSVDIVLAPATDSDPPLAAISTWEDISGINDTEATASDTQWLVGPTPTYVSATSFTLSGDQVSDFHIGRRVRSVNSGGTIYSTITDAVYTSLTTVTVENDSGILDSGLSSVSYALLTATNNSIPGGTHQATTVFNKRISFTKGADIASASALTLGADGNYFDVTGTTAITSIGTVGIGTIIKLQFDAALTLTHHATDLILPDATNITTAAGDEAEFIEYATGDWKLTKYLYSTTPKIQTSGLEQTGGSEAVTQATIRDAAVGQAQLKTTTGEVSTLNQAGLGFTLPGGEYGFFPQLKTTSSTARWGYNFTGAVATYAGSNTTTSYTTRVYLATAGGDLAYMQHRYIQASPPYDYGDGEALFNIFAVIDNATGEVESLYSAREAPWHYNGPTDIRAGYYRKDGMPCRQVCRVEFEKLVHGLDITASLADPIKRDHALTYLSDPEPVELEIRQEIKNRDMGLIPHPFIDNDLTGKTVVMLDPITDLMGQLDAIQRSGDDVSKLIYDKYITIDNTAIPRVTPNGVIVVNAAWKNTV